MGKIITKNMEKIYKKIELNAGDSIETAINCLSKFKEGNELAYCTFNGENLYSDIDNLNSAYKKITGKTKSEFDKEITKINLDYEKRKLKHKKVIEKLTKKWIEKGKSILDEKYHEKWVKCVPIRLNDLYEGMELSATLEIIKKLNSGCDLSLAKKLIEKQNHSGMSFALVCSMVKAFCDRGSEFVDYIQLKIK